MHELGLLRSVVVAVEAAAAKADAAGVQTVALRVGRLSGATLEALHGSWPIAVAGSRVEGATLEIDDIPAAVWCPACAAEREADEFFALACPECGTPTGQLVRGREFEVAWVDLVTPDPN